MAEKKRAVFRVKGVVFDTYGTLAYFHNFSKHSRFFKKIEKTFGIKPKKPAVHLIRYEFYKREQNHAHFLKFYLQFNNCKVDKKTFSSLLKKFEKCSGRTVAYSDVIPTLKILRKKGIKLALNSNINTAHVNEIKSMPFFRFFDAAAFSCEESAVKPEKRIYEITARKLGLKPSEILWVGDQLEVDYLRPIQLGFNAILINRKHKPFSKRVHQIKTLKQLTKQGIELTDQNYVGTIIEESLENKRVLSEVKILSTRIERVTKKHKTPWLKQWTLHKVEVSCKSAESIARKISKAIDSKHANSWYVDFKNDKTHYIIFRNKIFRAQANKKASLEPATQYGIKLGIPAYQLDFEVTN
ncbi:HAD family hydrolase [Candidatus Micrarchaeota archaeon]|nr:HAD family hydrolase [Candidatus Micrarchaeota archaeon]